MKEGGKVRFPPFNAERHYMVPFLQSEGLPLYLSHWQETVDDMLTGIHTDKPVYFMADQAHIDGGSTHRRPGVHVDGYWVPHLGLHRGGGGHRGFGGGHRSAPLPGHRGSGGHISALAGQGMSGHQYGTWGVPVPGKWDSPGNNWSLIDFSEPQAMLLASDVQGAKAWTGLFNEQLIGEGGEASRVPVELLAPLDLKAGHVYLGNVSSLHASVPLGECNRSMVRLNVPGISIH